MISGSACDAQKYLVRTSRRLTYPDWLSLVIGLASVMADTYAVR
jgi:hypothetical protein